MLNEQQLNFNNYQKNAASTAIYPDIGNNHIYPALGLASESGEVLGIIKKVMRDKDNKTGAADKAKIHDELGDVLWYISQLATEFDLSLEDIAQNNLNKLKKRQKNGTLKDINR